MKVLSNINVSYVLQYLLKRVTWTHMHHLFMKKKVHFSVMKFYYYSLWKTRVSSNLKLTNVVLALDKNLGWMIILSWFMEGNLFINVKCVTKEANQNTHLKEHIKAVHEGKKPFQCLYCHWKFSEKSNLKTHVYNSWIEKAYKVWFLHLSIPRSLESTHNVSTYMREKAFSMLMLSSKVFRK